ncbi:MAG: hypothetical protein R2856_01760 [Caldilineaceae bacterium]
MTILDRLSHTFWKCRLDLMTTARTLLDLGLVLGHLNLHRWHVIYLAADVISDPTPDRSLALVWTVV